MSGNYKLDTEIVRLMKEVDENKAQNKVYSLPNIKTGAVVVHGQRVNFEKRQLFDGKIEMILPKDFQSIDPAKLYKPETKPDLLLVNDGGTVQITLTHLSKKAVNDEQVRAHQNAVQQILQQMNPSLQWLEGGVKTISEKPLSFFEFITPMLGTEVYNLTFFIRLDQRIFTGSFVCGGPELKGWKQIFYQILGSIEINESANPEELAEAAPAHRDFSQYHYGKGLYGIHQGREYRLFKIGDGYRLISFNGEDLDRGFFRQDGVFKKNVTQNEIEAAYELQLTLVYRGHQFELGRELKTKVQLIMKDCDRKLANELQLQMNYPVYEKWVDKTEIENIIEKKLPVAGFAIPENIAENQ
jgi:hypothetical protein